MACHAPAVQIPRKFLVSGASASLLLAAATFWPARGHRDDVITIATWNLEWLVDPATSHAGRLACRSGRRSVLPCDVAEDLARDSADLGRLAAHARTLDADIVAFQEVENEAIARKVFRGYTICMADGAGVQHVGFAVRPDVPHECGPAVDALSVEGRSRKAMSMRIIPQHGDPIQLLAVHLKSGCSREPIDSDTAACRLLSQQARRLGDWIAARAEQHEPFIVLGDFNRVGPQETDDEFWQLVRAAAVELVAERLPFSNCQAGQPYAAFIDHVLLGNIPASNIVPGSARHAGFRSVDAVRYRLSDHCPVSISLRLERPYARSP